MLLLHNLTTCEEFISYPDEDPMSLDLVRGGAVDYVESLGGAAFQVINPNAASGCGCGSSFSI